VTEEGLLQPALAQTAVYSAMADFECAFSEFAATVGGIEDAYWESTGWFTNQWSAPGDDGRLLDGEHAEHVGSPRGP
jgi:hypothetical protein